MKLHLLPCLIAAALASPAMNAAEPAPREWKPGTAAVDLLGHTPDASGALEIRASDTAVVPVLRDTQPGLNATRYVLLGEVKYEKVGGTGFLEMWNVFPASKPGQPESKYFTRALGAFGPMQKLEGNSAWREFMLPFNPDGAGGAPVRLELNVVLPDGGTVWLRNLRLTQPEPVFGFTWLQSDRASGVVGGLVGALIGILGSIIGTCLQSGKGRGVAQAALALMLLVGIVSAIGFVWAVAAKYWQWTPFGALALIALILFSKFRSRLHQRFGEVELRRMDAADA